MDPADGNGRAGCARHTPSRLASAYSEAVAEPPRTDLHASHSADHVAHSREASAVRFAAADPASPTPFPRRARIFVECSPARSGRTASAFGQVGAAAEFAVAAAATEGVRPDAYPGARGFRNHAGLRCSGCWPGEARRSTRCCGPRPEPDGSLETPRAQVRLQHYGARRRGDYWGAMARDYWGAKARDYWARWHGPRPTAPRELHGAAGRSGSGKLRVHPDVGRIRDARD